MTIEAFGFLKHKDKFYLSFNEEGKISLVQGQGIDKLEALTALTEAFYLKTDLVLYEEEWRLKTTINSNPVYELALNNTQKQELQESNVFVSISEYMHKKDKEIFSLSNSILEISKEEVKNLSPFLKESQSLEFDFFKIFN